MTTWGKRAKCGCEMAVTLSGHDDPTVDEVKLVNPCLRHGGSARKVVLHSCGCIIDSEGCRTNHKKIFDRRHRVDVSHIELAKLRTFLERSNGSWWGGQADRLHVDAGGAACIFYTDPWTHD